MRFRVGKGRLFERVVVLLFCGGGALTQHPTPVFAQAASAASTASPGLEEVVVTATRREERVQDVAVSVSAFSQAKLDAQGIRSIDDLTRLTPGISFQRNGISSAGGFNDEDTDINIRGVDSTAGASTVGLYIDDTPIQSRHITFTSFNSYPAVFDVERVEVLRGPQGTLFGAGSEGGSVRFISPQPDLVNYGAYLRSELSSTHNGDPSQELGAVVGGPISSGKLAFRLSGSYRDDGGWVDHVDWRTGQATYPRSNWQRTVTARAALKWAPTEQLTVTPSIYYQELKLGDTGAYWPELSHPDDAHFANGNAQIAPSMDPFYLAAVKVDYELGFAHLSSNTSYYSRDQHDITDYTQFNRDLFGFPPRAPYGDFGTSYDSDKQNNFFEELKLQSNDAKARIVWTTGFFYAHLNENTREFIFDPNLVGEYLAAFGTPLCTAQAPCPNGQLLWQPVSQIIDKQYALFGDAAFRITDTWKVTTGVRVAHLQYDGNIVYYGPWLSPTTGPGNPLAAAGSRKENPVTPKFALAYQPNHDNLFYASAAKGYRVGGINGAVSSLCGGTLTNIGLTQVPQTYAADSLWSYELGAKNTLFGGRVQINTSLFTIDWKNIQQAVYLAACGQNFVENLGVARSHGGDIDILARPVDRLQLELSAAYTDAKYTRTVCAGIAACTGPAAPTQPVVTEGDRLPGAPWTVIASGEYTFPVPQDYKPYLRLDYQLTTAQTALVAERDPNNGTSDPVLPGLPQTKTLAARFGVRWNGLDISLFGQNLTDSHPILIRSRDTTAAGSDLFFEHTLRPRTIGVTALYHY
jgi:iron complex outermembrane receptor protein